MASRKKNKKNKKNKRSSSSACSKSPVQAASKRVASKDVSISQAIQRAAQHHQAGELQKAETTCKQVLGFNPDNSSANYLLGIIAYQTGRRDEALQYFQKVVQINPDFVDAYHNLGLVYKELGHFEVSIDSYRKALSLNPDQAETYTNLGNVLHRAGKLDEAMDSYKKAISLDPGFAEAHGNLGNVLKDLGKLDEAIDGLRKCISLKPDSAEAHFSLIFLKKYTEDDADLNAMQALYSKKDISDSKKIYLSFGLGKAYEDLKDYEKAFGYFLEGNRLKRETYEYSISQQMDAFSRIKDVFNKSFFENNAGAGNQDNAPIFILGMPRAGTSLVEQILASHPYVFGAGELHIIPEMVKRLRSVQSTNEYPGCVLDFDKEAFNSLGNHYIERIRSHSADKKYITDKLPDNFRMVGLIKAILPNAKIIHCMRDPMDTCLSIFKNYFIELDSYAYHMIELGQYYNLYLDLMDHWRTVLPGLIYDIKYEDVVSDQEGQTRELLEYCGLPWDEACMSYHKTKRKVTTVSAVQVRRPIYSDSVQLWKRYETQLAPLHTVLSGGKGDKQTSDPDQLAQGELEKILVSQILQEARQCHQAGQLKQAENLYRQILALEFDHPESNHLLGVIAYQVGKNKDAVQLIQQSILANPHNAEAHNNLGLVYQALGQMDTAITSHRKALAISPRFPQAHYNLGNALKISGQTDEAIVSYREAIAINPDYANAYTNLGVSLVKAGQLDEAIASQQKAISINPDFIEAWRNLGNVLRDSGQLNEAEAAFNKALMLMPDDPDTLFSQSLLDLQRGNYEEGWNKYEARFQAKKFAGDYPALPIPRWQGQPLNGKKLFVWTEQGIGDAIQFIRYLERLKKENVQIWFCCSPGLQRLFHGITTIDRFVRSEEVTTADYHIPLMSLPAAYKTTLESILHGVPYVYPDEELVEQWRERLQSDDGFRVGLAWAGNPDNDNDVFRSIQLKEFSALMSMPGVSIYSLQKGAGSEQARALDEGMKLVDTTADQTDLLATAGLIANLDLIITVDTAIAHLAGAMGKPVWMCLSANPDWRWLLEREDSPWYPTMRLYRQEQLGEWELVMKRLATDLRGLVKVS